MTKYGNWSSPFAPWVVESWRRHSEAIGGPAIAEEIRKNLLAKAVEQKEPKMKLASWKDDCKIEQCYVQTRTTERPGGQHAGTPAMFIRVTHIPTGTVAESGEMRSQFQQKKIAMLMIETALVEMGVV